MRRLLSMLLFRGSERWWHLRVSEGDPPEERSYMFELPALLKIVHRKLTDTEVKDEVDTRPEV